MASKPHRTSQSVLIAVSPPEALAERSEGTPPKGSLPLGFLHEGLSAEGWLGMRKSESADFADKRSQEWQHEQAAGKRFQAVILSEAKNLALRIFKTIRDPSSSVA
jgi:hypothetical protein